MTEFSCSFEGRAGMRQAMYDFGNKIQCQLNELRENSV